MTVWRRRQKWWQLWQKGWGGKDDEDNLIPVSPMTMLMMIPPYFQTTISCNRGWGGQRWWLHNWRETAMDMVAMTQLMHAGPQQRDPHWRQWMTDVVWGGSSLQAATTTATQHTTISLVNKWAFRKTICERTPHITFIRWGYPCHPCHRNNYEFVVKRHIHSHQLNIQSSSTEESNLFVSQLLMCFGACLKVQSSLDGLLQIIFRETSGSYYNILIDKIPNWLIRSP